MKNLTRQAMADSLRTLLRERPLSRISVRDITEGCHVNRQMIRNAYDPVNRIQYETLFTEYVYPRVKDYILSHRGERALANEDVDFIASFYTQALSGFLIKWI